MVNENELQQEAVMLRNKLRNETDKEKKREIIVNDVSYNYNVLFTSFDIVNSTQYKVQRIEWLDEITNIFNELQKRIELKISEAQLWRVIGDEIIFIVKVNSISSLSDYVKKVFAIIQDMNLRLDDRLNHNYEKLKNINAIEIGLQGAIWLAPVTDESKNQKPNAPKNGNVFIRYNNVGRNPIKYVFEFMGNDIDTGFRIKKFTQKGRLVVSFELACLLAESTIDNSYLHIITFKRLKGVWDNKLYPIIWYHNDSTMQSEKFSESFKFDDASENELIKEYFENVQGKGILLNANMYENTFEALQIIIRERRFQYKIDAIKELFQESGNSRILSENDQIARLQLSAVCYDSDSGTILILKRSNEVVVNKGKWEFGHVIADSRLKNKDCVENGYKEKYGICISVEMENNRIDEQPIPLYLYQYERESEYPRGITVLAKVLNKEKVVNKGNEYVDVKWIREEEIEKLSPKECVEDLKNSLHKAFEYFRREG